ncbi:MAG TPA: peptidoglycan DD-metalloendopeptidase family protein, partial [Polyangiales bacterium]|nr:peptidoglycan DD-metalloendopeptidase family protein [Polyangiales bacterium]
MSGYLGLRSRWWALAVVASVGCAAEVADSGSESDEVLEPDDVGVAAEALHTCRSWSATRSSHISAGRARWVGTRVLANGSDQQLTSSGTQVMSEPSPRYFVVGSCPTQLYFRFPLNGAASRDWTIQYYTNLANDGTTLRDYQGGTRTKYDVGGAPHSGTDITIANFRRQDAGMDVFAAEDGTVIEVQNANPDRNTSCGANPNLVRIRHRTGVSTLYLHLRRNSITVTNGQFVRRGDKIGQVGSSGCSFWPHLHFEVREFDGTIVCPFRDNMWVSMPAYNPPYDLMDIALISGDQGVLPNTWADPRTNITKVFAGGVFTTTAYVGGGNNGEVVQVDVLDAAGTMINTGWHNATTGDRFGVWPWFFGLNAGSYTMRARIGTVTKTTLPLRVAPGGILYQAHMAGRGWTNVGWNGGVAGLESANVNIEAFKMNMTGSLASGVCYSVSMQNTGWLPEVCGPTETGVPGGANGIEAIRVRLTGAQAGCSVRYRAQVRGTGWT